MNIWNEFSETDFITPAENPKLPSRNRRYKENTILSKLQAIN